MDLVKIASVAAEKRIVASKIFEALGYGVQEKTASVQNQEPLTYRGIVNALESLQKTSPVEAEKLAAEWIEEIEKVAGPMDVIKEGLRVAAPAAAGAGLMMGGVEAFKRFVPESNVIVNAQGLEEADYEDPFDVDRRPMSDPEMARFKRDVVNQRNSTEQKYDTITDNHSWGGRALLGSAVGAALPIGLSAMLNKGRPQYDGTRDLVNLSALIGSGLGAAGGMMGGVTHGQRGLNKDINNNFEPGTEIDSYDETAFNHAKAKVREIAGDSLTDEEVNALAADMIFDNQTPTGAAYRNDPAAMAAFMAGNKTKAEVEKTNEILRQQLAAQQLRGGLKENNRY